MADLADCITSGSYKRDVRHQQVCKSKVSRIILPFHPCFRHANSMLRTLHNDFLEAGFGNLIPVVSYRNSGVGLDQFLLSDSKKKLFTRVPGGA